MQTFVQIKWNFCIKLIYTLQEVHVAVKLYWKYMQKTLKKPLQITANIVYSAYNNMVR